jgi:predicted dehydrogenase
MPLKLAIIGTGRVARDNYVPFLARQPDVELAYWNRTPASASALARQHGGVVLPDLAAVGAWAPAAAFVLTSERVRTEVGTALIEAGVPRIFFEKPLMAAAGQANVSEQDFAAARAMLELARRRGCETAIVFNYRFFDHAAGARAVIAERAFGRVLNVTGFVHYACWSHCIDLIRHFCGNLAEISALGGPESRHSGEIKTDAADVAAAFVTEGGAAGTLLGTAGADWEHPLYELTLNFEHGRLHLRDLDGSLEIYDRRSGTREVRALPAGRTRWDQYRDSFDRSVAAYLATLRAGGPPPIPAIEGLYELQAEAGLKRSIALRRPVRLAAEFPV